jgi:hypothetical protein
LQLQLKLFQKPSYTASLQARRFLWFNCNPGSANRHYFIIAGQQHWSADSQFLVTMNENQPGTVWIWDMVRGGKAECYVPLALKIEMQRIAFLSPS